MKKTISAKKMLSAKKTISAVLLAATGIMGCNQKNVPLTPLASVNVVNAVPDLGPVKVNFSGKGSPNYYSANTVTTDYGANTMYGVTAGMTVPLTIAKALDSTVVFNGNLQPVPAGIYTLYLCGKAGALDTMMIGERLPLYADSSCGIRFINLSLNSHPITVTQVTTPTIRESEPLAYRKATGLRRYPALSVNATYSFQIRDAETDMIIATYVLTAPRFSNCTLAWIGETGGTGTSVPKIQRINHYQ